MVRRITRDLHTQRLIEFLTCDSHLQVPLHRKSHGKCFPECSPADCNALDIETTFVYRLLPRLLGPHRRCWTSLHHIFLRGGGSASFSKIGASVRSTLGTQTLMSMRQFLEDAEKENEKENEKETGTRDTELEVTDSTAEVTDSTTKKTGACDPEVMDSSTPAHKVGAQKEAIMALRMLFEDVKYQDEVNEESTSESEGSPEGIQTTLIDETCHSQGVNVSNKIMVFLPGLAQIFQFCEILQRAFDLGWTEMLIPLPFHGQSSTEDVEAVFSAPAGLASTGKYPMGQNPNMFAPESFQKFAAPPAFQEMWAAYREPRFARSCIVCTNVAKSGITIPNVGLVISSGVQRRVSTDIRTAPQ